MISERIDAVTKISPERMMAFAPAPKSVKIEVSPKCNYRCLRGDTMIDTIYGPIAIKELSMTHPNGIPVYTYKDGEVFISNSSNIRKYGENERLVRVSFDDGTHIDCTPDHEFLRFKSRGATGGTDEYVTQAQFLKEKDRVRAFVENDNTPYIDIWCGRYFHRKRSRLIMDYIMGRKLSRHEIVHHIDGNKRNDHPSNLEYVESAKEHAKRHPELAERMRNNNPVLNMTDEWREKLRLSITGKTRTLEQRLKYRASKLGILNPNFKDGSSTHRSRIADVNHKVTSVTFLDEIDDVYCLTVPDTGWFFANKVLVKNCGFCALRTRENQPDTDMPIEFFRRIVGEMADAGVEEIGLFYLGESTMNPDLLVECLRATKAAGIGYVFLTTNGSLLTDKLLLALMAGGLNSLKFSINAADEDQFAEVMAVKKSYFNRALNNLRLAREIRDAHGYKTGIYASSIRYDGEQQEKMDALLKDRVLPFVDEHYWLPLYSMGSFATAREEELGYKPIAGNQGRLAALRDPLPCWSAFTEGHVTADGRLSACCFDANSNWTMGDLNTTPFMEAWNSTAFTELRAAHLAGDVSKTVCADCVAYK